MVRRFVEDEEIRFLEKEAQERETCLLSAGEHGDLLEYVIAAEQEHPEDISGFLLSEIEGVTHFVKDGKLGVESLLLLRVVAHLHIIAELDDAAVCRLFSRDELQKRGLARAIRADEAEYLPFFDVKVQILKNQMILIGGFRTHDIEYLLRTFLRRIKVETERRLMDRLIETLEAVQL